MLPPRFHSSMAFWRWQGGAALPPSICGAEAVLRGITSAVTAMGSKPGPHGKQLGEGGEEENQESLQMCKFGVVFFHHFQQESSQVPAANPITPSACARAGPRCQPGHRIPPEPPTKGTGEGARLSPSTKTPQKSHGFLAATTAAPSENAAGDGAAGGVSPRLSRTQGRTTEPRSREGTATGGHARLGRHLLA